jgi:hypothetical protein
MIDLSQGTVDLARRLADTRHVPVDTVVKDALAPAARGSPLIDPHRTVTPRLKLSRVGVPASIASSKSLLPCLFSITGRRKRSSTICTIHDRCR